MNKLFLLTLVVVLSSIATPAFAQKRSEYNFNTCNYNFYGNANPMNGQGAGGAPVNFYKGVGVTNATTDKLRATMSNNAAIYQVTPQRTLTIDNWGFNKRKRVNQQQQVQMQPMQQPQYLYVPGQNNTTQTSTQCSVSFDKSGAMQYSSGGGGGGNTGATTYNTNNTNTNNK